MFSVPATKVPPLTATPPVKLLTELFRFKVPAPVLVSPPVPARVVEIVPPVALTLVLVKVPAPVIDPPEMVNPPLLALAPTSKEPLDTVIESDDKVLAAPSATAPPFTRSPPLILFTPFKLTVPPDAVTPPLVVVKVPVEVKVPAEFVNPTKLFALLFINNVPPLLLSVVPVRFPPARVTVAALLSSVTAEAVIPPASTVIVAVEFKAALSLVLKATALPVPSVSQFCAVVFHVPLETDESQT